MNSSPGCKFKIIDELLDAGNQCLIRFSDRTELASEHDKRVFLLYQCIENFFLHGLKENQNPFNLTRKMISNSLSNSPKYFNQFVTSKDCNSAPNFWQFVTFFLNKHEIERYTQLKNIKTSIGRCRAFIRSSLNEHSLERFLKSMLDNGSTIVKQFYDEDAAIRDLSGQNEILDLVGKLNLILFASTIDNPNLNCSNTSLTNNYHRPTKGRNESNDQRHSTTQVMNQIQVNQSISQNECEEKARLNSSLSRTNSSKAEMNLPLSRNSSYSSNCQQDDLEDKSDDETNQAMNSNILLTPIFAGNYSVTDQFLATNYDEDEKAFDFSNQSCSTSCSSTPAFQSKELANFEKTKRQFDREFNESLDRQKSNNNLKENKSMRNRKLFTTSPDQIEQEERISKLESQNVQLRNENKQLKVQLKKYVDAISFLSYNDRNRVFKSFECANADSSIEESTAIVTNDENDLSEQISEKTSLIATKNSNHHSPKQQVTERASDYKRQILGEFNTNAYLNYRDSVEYERKLVQVAEMFSEIVDYNDRLNRVLMQKDATIKVLKDQLIELRGPLPDNIQSDEDEIVSIASVAEDQSLEYNSILAQNLRPLVPLISLWIPSAFLADQKQTYQNTYLGADQPRSNKKVSSHHVYQIYIRIKDDEWNVYRRYSQFYFIHQILKKKYQQIAELEFPPKKITGNRHARVVQERRKKLEAYLRNVLNILQNDNNIYDRSTLIEVLPFLCERYIQTNSNKSNETSVKSVNRDNNTGESVVQQDYLGL